MSTSKQERDRARWRQNKRNQRARSAPPPPRTPPHDLIDFVTAERDRRAEYNDAVLVWRHAAYIKSGTREKATAFVADVWAARTMLEWQLGTDKATATAITHWLQSHGRTHGYTEGSLRVMVYRALERIKLLEREEPEVTYRWWSGWRPLDLSEWSNQEG